MQFFSLISSIGKKIEIRKGEQDSRKVEVEEGVRKKWVEFKISHQLLLVIILVNPFLLFQSGTNFIFFLDILFVRDSLLQEKKNFFLINIQLLWAKHISKRCLANHYGLTLFFKICKLFFNLNTFCRYYYS